MNKPILKTELSPKRVTASPEMMEYGKQLAKEFWEAKDRKAKGLSVVGDPLQTEHQKDFDDATADKEWTP